MRFFALAKHLSLAIWRNGVHFALVARSDKERSLGIESQRPNVFGFRIEEDGVLAVRRDLVNFAVRRSARVHIVLLIDRQRLGLELAGIEDGRRLSRCIDS